MRERITLCLLLLIGQVAWGGLCSAQGDCADPSGEIFVTTESDDGPGSLREAIICANTTPGPNIIRFDIPGLDTHIINIGSVTGMPLPVLADAGTTIDGTSQPGFGINNDIFPKIILDGIGGDWLAPVNGLEIQGDSCRIFALEIRNFPYNGIYVNNADEVVLGDPFRGNIIFQNGEPLDFYPNDPGGPYNGSGIYLRNSSNDCIIQNNIIGTNRFMAPNLGNEFAGIRLDGGVQSNLIGSTQTGRGNLIYGNPTGIEIDNALSTEIRRNSFLCNDTAGIHINPGGFVVTPPSIAQVNPDTITGTAPTGATVEVYRVDKSACPFSACQGSTYLGSAVATGGTWQLVSPFANGIVLGQGDNITATATNTSNSTSAFASCKAIVDLVLCSDSAGVILVTNTNDDGMGSFRQAILCANAIDGPNQIHFALPGLGPHTIFVGSTTEQPLPELTDAGTTIDGTTQAGFGDIDNRPQIILDGSLGNWQLPYNALFILGQNIKIFGLQIQEFPDDAIDITNGSEIIIGRADGGNVILNNGYEIDTFPGLPNSGPWNGSGIVIKGNSADITIHSNVLGTDFLGLANAPNELAGIRVFEGVENVEIGNDSTGANVIAHHPFGIRLEGDARRVKMIGNEFYCNQPFGIAFEVDTITNDGILPPEIDTTMVTLVAGRGAPGTTIHVYLSQQDTCLDAPCQGSTYLGKTQVDPDSTWSISGPFANGPNLLFSDQVTATTTDTFWNTSGFSNCQAVMDTCDLVMLIDSILPDTCGAGTGQFVVQVTSSYGPVVITVNGDTASGFLIDSLIPGIYIVEVTDQIGCTQSFNVEINPVNLVEAGFDFFVDENMISLFNTSPNSTQVNWFDEDGIFASGDSASLLVFNTGFQNICQEVINPCNADTLCESILVFGPGDEVGLCAGNVVSGGDFMTILVPLVVTNFNAVAGLQLSMNIDPSIGIFTGVSNLNLVGLTQNLFSINDSTISLSWFDNTFNGVTLPDSTAIFFAEILLVNPPPDCFDILLTDDPTEIQVVRIIEGTDVIAPFIAKNGMICFEFIVAGEIFREDGMAVGQAAVSGPNGIVDTTGADGQYLLLFPGVATQVTIDPQKQTIIDNGITVFDMFIIQQHLLQINLLTSPYKHIAADIDQNGSLSIFDLVILQQILLQNLDTFPNNESWRFVDESYVFLDPQDPLGEPFPETITWQPGQANTNLDFVGIKIGDVSLDNNPLAIQFFPEFPVKGELVEVSPGHWKLGCFAMEANEFVAFQSSLSFSPKTVNQGQFEWATPFQIGQLGANESLQEEGHIPFLWLDAEPVSVDKGDLLFTLTFKGDAKDLKAGTAFSLQNSPLPSYAFKSDGSKYRMHLSTLELKENATGYPDWYPNPAFSSVSALIPVDISGNVKLDILDSSGRLWASEERFLPEGTHEWRLDLSRLPSAQVLIIRVNTPGKTWSSSIIRQE